MPELSTMTNMLKSNLHVRPTLQLKSRVESVKPLLKVIGLKVVTEIITRYYPIYNTIEGGKLIDQVYYGRKADIALTEILEQIASGELK